MTTYPLRSIVCVVRKAIHMTIAEFIRYLQKQGVKFKEHGARHDVYWNPKTGDEAQIPRHTLQEVKTGTKDRILKDLGLK